MTIPFDPTAQAVTRKEFADSLRRLDKNAWAIAKQIADEFDPPPPVKTYPIRIYTRAELQQMTETRGWVAFRWWWQDEPARVRSIAAGRMIDMAHGRDLIDPASDADDVIRTFNAYNSKGPVIPEPVRSLYYEAYGHDLSGVKLPPAPDGL